MTPLAAALCAAIALCLSPMVRPAMAETVSMVSGPWAGGETIHAELSPVAGDGSSRTKGIMRLAIWLWPSGSAQPADPVYDRTGQIGQNAYVPLAGPELSLRGDAGAPRLVLTISGGDEMGDVREEIEIGPDGAGFRVTGYALWMTGMPYDDWQEYDCRVDLVAMTATFRGEPRPLPLFEVQPGALADWGPATAVELGLCPDPNGH